MHRSPQSVVLGLGLTTENDRFVDMENLRLEKGIALKVCRCCQSLPWGRKRAFTDGEAADFYANNVSV